MASSSAFRSPARWLVTGLVALLTLIGLGFLVAGVIATASGHDESWFPAVLGLQLTVLGALAVANLLPTRATPPPAEPIEIGVALPLRSGYAGRQAGVVAVAGSLLLPAALRDGGLAVVILGIAALLVGFGLCGWLITTGADRARLLLDADGITVPGGLGSSNRLAWRDVKGAQAVPRWQPLLVVIPKREATEPIVLRLLPQAWSPEALTDLVEFYAAHAGRRTDLSSADAFSRRTP
ncbi:hypothetical protein [Nocardioides sp. InS609-2]|uniref:hypothetical protein n=1 Tax=Nocardioides sp. InS609-2 TaxID=2760705 RepID=UPI0020C0DE0C|nr:hypothetical protein [Nocardioides sp. InS609-2]